MPVNAATPSTVELPDATPDHPAEGTGGGGVVIIDSGSGGAGSPEASPVLIGGRVVAAQALVTALDGLTSARDAGEAAVTDAGATLASAQRQLAEMEGDPDTADEQRVVDQATARLERATTALDELRAASGATVPLGELVFVPTFPVRVDALAASVGTPVGSDAAAPGDIELLTGNSAQSTADPEPLMVLAPAGLVARSRVGASDLPLIHLKARAQLLDETTGEVIDVIVNRIGPSQSNGQGVGLAEVDLVGVRPLPVSWSGREVRVTITTEVSSGASLVVPLAAVTLDSDGMERVEVVGSGGTTRSVAVTAGVSANGFVEVEPISAGDLSDRDEVAVGIDAPVPATLGSLPVTSLLPATAGSAP